MMTATEKPADQEDPQDPVLEAILHELDGIRFGQVTVTVQDGHVVQIERVERRRLKAGESTGGDSPSKSEP